jgi:hypothetical protein
VSDTPFTASTTQSADSVSRVSFETTAASPRQLRHHITATSTASTSTAIGPWTRRALRPARSLLEIGPAA